MVKKAAASLPKGGGVERAVRHLESTIVDATAKYEYSIEPGKQLLLTFIKGIVSGLGVICAVAIVIPIVVALLRGIQWVPIVGDFVSRIATEVEQARRP